MGAILEDIGAQLKARIGVTPDNWDGASDIEGDGIDRIAIENPLSAKVFASLGDTTASDEVVFSVQESDDDSTYTEFATLTPTHADPDAVLDIKLTGRGRYIRVVADASESTVGTNLDLQATVIFGGLKVRG